MTEVEYISAPLMKRFASYFIDIGIFLLTTIFIFILSNSIISSTHDYRSKLEEQTSIGNESCLYENNVRIDLYINDETFTNNIERLNYLTSNIYNFYHNSTFFDSTEEFDLYVNRMLLVQEGNAFVFVQDVENGIALNKVDPAIGIQALKKELLSNTLIYLYRYSPYLSITQYFAILNIIQICASATICFTLLYLILPLTVFKRGRQTIGMKILNISLINIHALNVSTGIYIGRFFFLLIFCLYLNVFAFLIPSFINIGMLLLGKRAQTAVNYIFNDYVVYTKNDQIFLNEFERFDKQNNIQNISLENKDLTISH